MGGNTDKSDIDIPSSLTDKPMLPAAAPSANMTNTTHISAYHARGFIVHGKVCSGTWTPKNTEGRKGIRVEGRRGHLYTMAPIRVKKEGKDIQFTSSLC